MKIGFTFTNYNNSSLSIQAAQSIFANHGEHQYEIVLVDNASREEERQILSEPGSLPERCSVLWNSSNVGYFDGLNLGIQALLERSTHYDAIVIGNNDLVFEREFFDGILRCKELLEMNSVVSPDILTLDNEHQNPHVISAISRLRELLWDLYFSNYQLSRIISFAARLSRTITGRRDHHLHSEAGPIYQGYGACYIVTPKFLQAYKRLWSPGFLMGEEFYLARQLAAQSEQVYCTPDIQVRHHDHATISKLPSRRLWETTREAHQIYRFFVNPFRYEMDNGKTPNDYDISISARAK